MRYFRQNRSQIKIDNKGIVRVSFVENFPMSTHLTNIDRGYGSDVDQQNPSVQCRLIGSIIKRAKNYPLSQFFTFSHIIMFPRDALLKLGETLDKKKINLERQIKIIRTEQSKLPKKYFNYSKYENLIEDLKILEDKRADHITAKLFYENLVVVYCGCYLKYGRLGKTESQINNQPEVQIFLQETDGEILKDIDIKFSDSVEIVKIIETQKRNWLQIYTIDHNLNIIQIIIWDFHNNMEQGIFQWRIDQDKDDIGYHLVKGMN